MSLLHMLDTDVASYLIRGSADTRRERLSDVDPDRLCVSVMTRAELMFGLQRLAPDNRLHVGVRRFLHLVQVLPWGSEAADHYARIRHGLTMAGRLIGEIDMMIAAHSLAADAVLVTNNLRHFTRIEPSLAVRAWSER